MECFISKSSNPSRVTPILVDYLDIALLKEKLEETIAHNGPIELVIAWIHSYAETVLESIASEISGIWKLFHVLGSSANLNEIKDKIHLLDIIHYRQVQLGFIMENGQSRWLTHKEISQGVIDAIQHDRSINIVGTLQPWEQRPL